MFEFELSKFYCTTVIENCIGDSLKISRDKRGAAAGLVRGVQLYSFTKEQGWRRGAEITLLTSQEESCWRLEETGFMIRREETRR